MPYRPLQQKVVTKEEAWLFSIIMHLAAFSLAFTLSLKLTILMIVFFVLSFFYSTPPIAFSRRSLWGQVELVVCTISLPLYSGIVLASNSFLPPENIIPPLTTLSIFFIFLLILKDFKDILGNGIRAKKTFVLKKGEIKAFTVMVVGSVVFFSLTTLFFYQIFDNFFFILISHVILVFLLKTELEVFSDSEAKFTEARVIVLVYVLSLLAFSFSLLI
jgi:4-hydroxybenzoate polyprenyltransferase